jgi:SNF2 family DNA or RNA helicase
VIISQSKKVEGKARHVVLVCDQDEVSTAGYVIAEVLGKGVAPVRRMTSHTEDGKAINTYRYLFNMRYLDDLLMAFPLATKSAGMQRKLDRLNARNLEQKEVEPFEVPGLWNYAENCEIKPYPFQYVAIAEAVRFLNGDMDGQVDDVYKFIESFLENDEMGLGKTLMALCIVSMLMWIQERELKVLVIAPKNGKFVWHRENQKFMQLDLGLTDADTQDVGVRRRIIGERHTLTVINPEMLRGVERSRDGEPYWVGKHPELFDFEYDLCIIDEYHRFGSPTSLQSKGLQHIKAARWLPMSGTPFLNRPTQLWVMMKVCWPELFPDYGLFQKGIEIKEPGSGKVIGYKPQVTGLLKKFMADRSIRRRKDQVLKDLPPIRFIDMPIELTREQRKIYDTILNELKLVLEDGSTEMIHQMSIIMRLKQACFSPELFGGSKHSGKLDELYDSIPSMVESGEKILLGSNWSTATRILQRDLAHYNPAYVDGSVSGARRMLQADKFNNNPDCQIYIGTIGANREAVSLGAATTVILTDKDWSPQVNAQFIGRSAAGGLRGVDATVDSVSVVSMFASQSYEEGYEQVLRFKEGTFDSIVEGDGGRKREADEMKSFSQMLREILNV